MGVDISRYRQVPPQALEDAEADLRLALRHLNREPPDLELVAVGLKAGLVRVRSLLLGELDPDAWRPTE